MILSKTSKKKFCKDYGIPIQVYEEPYFTDRIIDYGYQIEYMKFQEMIQIKFHGNEKAFLDEYDILQQNIINYIKETDVYKTLNEIDINQYKCKYKIANNDLYIDKNIGHSFLSIDIKKANYSSLMYLNRKLNLPFGVNNYNYEDFIGTFTNNEYFKKSKHLRQIIFGNCNPKRQIIIERYIIDQIIEDLLMLVNASYINVDGGEITERSEYLTLDDVYSINNDEIIIKMDRFHSDIKRCINNLFTENAIISKKILGVPIEIKYFKLDKLQGSNAYIKKYESKENEFEIKACPISEYLFVYKYLNNIEIKDNDLVFTTPEGYLAKYLEIPVKLKR